VPTLFTPMNDAITSLKESLVYSEATIEAILTSCRDWVEDEIKESGEDFVKGLQRRIINRHPKLSWVIDPLEF